jgi:DNA-binding GntR family transcriptional regulator
MVPEGDPTRSLDERMANHMIIPPTRATAAAKELRRRILEGEYPGGMQLRQAALARELGISRIPFREALIQLEAEGLVQLEAHKGAVVAAISADDVEELFEVRALLEPYLLERSAPLLTEADFAELNAILEEYSEELRRSHVGRWGELNTLLHSLLYRHAGRPRTLAIVDQLLQSTDRFTRMQLYYTDGRARAEREHAKIVRLCAAGKYAKAARALHDHIENAGKKLARLLRAHQPLSARGAR